MNIHGIIQARETSSRFPNKILQKIGDKTLLELYVDRVKYSSYISKIIVAIGGEGKNIETLCKDNGWLYFKGDENNVLDRFYQCAKHYKSDIIVRLTSDDPFVDPDIIDKGIHILLNNNDIDFVTNHFYPSFPEGLDIEIYNFNTLEKMLKIAKYNYELEHLYPTIQNNLQEFNYINFKSGQNNSDLRWTIDYECDLEMTKKIYENWQNNTIFKYNDILKILNEHPEIKKINSHIKRKEGLQISKEKEKFSVISKILIFFNIIQFQFSSFLKNYLYE